MLYTEIPNQRPVTPLLDTIDHPKQLRQLAKHQLAEVADELRQFILYAAGQSGGHFGANLGVVELTVALHYCFNTPQDRLIWDVGHQAYPHKALTGRREKLTTIRAKNGLAAFPTREESEFDTFGVGHSSTAISAGLGMSLARRHLKDPCDVVAIIGDGAMTAGMAFEAMNDAVAHQADLMVVLNDNDMSISCSTGGFAKHLAAIWEKGQSVHINEQGEPYLQDYPAWDYTSRLHCSATDAADNLFKAIGFDYFGPFDGHNVEHLVEVLNAIKKRKGPRLIHVYTKKGKGFAPAEAEQIKYHAISKLDAVASSASAPKYSDVFGQWLCDEAAQDERLLAITPAMCEGSGMVEFAKKFPERYFDVAIAEQHAVTLAAGMACEGLKPVVAIYSTFLQRGYDQLIHDVALQNLDVTFALDRAGLVGEDGPTHAGAYDYAFMRTVPNMVIMAPKDENECRQMLHTAYQYSGPAAVRYPRGAGLGVTIEKQCVSLEIGQAEQVLALNTEHAEHDEGISILAFGSRVSVAVTAAEQLAQQFDVAVRVINMRFIKPLDENIIRALADKTQLFVTVEEHAVMAGAGSAVNEFLAHAQIVKPILNLGLPDQFLAQATHSEMLKDCGLDAKGIEKSIIQAWSTLTQLV